MRRPPVFGQLPPENGRFDFATAEKMLHLQNNREWLVVRFNLCDLDCLAWRLLYLCFVDESGPWPHSSKKSVIGAFT